jgi:hypothetical protein
MGYGSLVRNVGLPLAKSLLGGQDGLMDDVTIQFWIQDTDVYGTGEWSQPVAFQAVVERIQKMVKKSDGQEAMAASYIAFLEEIPPRGTGGDRKEPLDPRDIITLSDGTTGPILTMTGLMDQATSAMYLIEVFLG